MLSVWRSAFRNAPGSDVILAFIQSWGMHGADETSISSGTLDIIRAYLSERPCCIWKKVSTGLTRISERGMVEVLYSQGTEGHERSLTKAVVSGVPEFDACPVNVDSEFEGYLHVPIRLKEDVIGILSLAVSKKEARDRQFVEPLECLCRLVAIALRHALEQERFDQKEQNLRSELSATARELELTNKRLIERVKELKTLSHELEERVKELTQANKAKDEFLSIVSHELRTPLTSLNGFLCVLLDGEAGSLTDEQKKFLSIAKQSATRLNLLIGDLLDISRIESGRLTLDMVECSIFEILNKSIEGLKTAATEKKIQIRLDAIPILSPIWGDESRLQQVIDNLAANAIKFTRPEGKVEIMAEEREDFVQVSVKDNGPGLAPEEQKKIFDKFYQVDPSSRRTAGGVGLGLSIAHGIIAMHGGQIWVESQMGQGATFHFMIPRSKIRKVA